MSEMSRNSPITDCSNCGHLCVGSRILPCCHLLCQKCLLQLLETETVCCPSCHSIVQLPDPTLSRQLLQFPTDVAMEQLVMETLAEWSGKSCHVPHDPSSSCLASHVCLDCSELFCDGCSHVHRNSSLSKHHTLQPLESVESPSDQQPTLSRRLQWRDDSTSGNQQNQLQEAVKAEAQLFHLAMTAGDQAIDEIKSLLTERESVQRVLKTYNHHLVCDDDVSRNDVILRRFRHVGKECLSAAEGHMEHLHQMPSRKIHKEKINTPSAPQRRETGQEGRHSDLTWTRGQMVVWVAVPVLCSLLLLLLMPVVIRPSSDPAVPYTADRVVMLPLDSQSSSTPALLSVSDVMVTADRRVVQALWKQQSLVVQDSSGSQTIGLGCHPHRVTQLPSGLIAVTCPLSNTVLLVNLGSSDPQIQRIKTKKWYWIVTAHPVQEALIVATVGPKPTVDVITLQGDVLQTLVDNRHKIPGDISTLSVVGEYLLMACSGSRQIYWIHHSDPRQPAEAFGSEFPKKPEDIAVDNAGNVFIVLEDGAVLVKDTAGQYRMLLAGKSDGKKYMMYRIAVHDNRMYRIAVYDNRLLVANVTDSLLNTVVTEYLLVDQ